MGSFFRKPIKIDNDYLTKSLIEKNLNERIIYLEDKIDNLDAKVWSFESKTESNLNTIYNKLKMKTTRIRSTC